MTHSIRLSLTLPTRSPVRRIAETREPHAGAAEARQQMGAVCQVPGVKRHRIHAREPEAPRPAPSDLGKITHRF